MNSQIQEIINTPYPFGFESNIAQEVIQKGLNEGVIRFISKKKNEPNWLLNWRLKAFENWQNMKEPHWGNVAYPKINYQNIIYFAGINNKLNKKNEVTLENWESSIDPEILKTFQKLGVPIKEQQILAGVAVDAIIDSVSVTTTFKKTLGKLGIIFCSFSEAVIHHPDLVKKYLGYVVPPTDNFFACLNSAVFSDGSFVYIPKNTKCPMELSSYFRINMANIGQFERTLIVCEEGGFVSYLEGCSAPMRSENQLHAAVVEIVALDNAEIKYSTVQNWYPGDGNGNGGIYNFVTKRGKCQGVRSKISWTQVETGSAITWKYPSVILNGDYSTGEFYSLALTTNNQQADTGTKMIHTGKHTRSRIISKGISAGSSSNTYRGKVKITKNAMGSKNYTKCDSLILSKESKAYTIPIIESGNSTSQIEHEASTGRISEKTKFYLQTRGMDEYKSSNLIIHGFSREILKNLPMEFAVEAKKLVEINLEGFVG